MKLVGPLLVGRVHVPDDADDLSFFTLNSWGFVRYFGPEHTRTKVAYTLGRMRPAARRHLTPARYHPEIARLLAEHGALAHP